MKARSYEAGFGRIVRLVRWLELAGVFSIFAMDVFGLFEGSDHLSMRQRGVIFWAAALMMAYTLAAESIGRHEWVARARLRAIALDLVFVSVIISQSGGLQSVFFGLYYLVAISAAIWYGMRGSLVTSAVALACAVAAQVYSEGLPVHWRVPEVFTKVPYLFIIALMSGALTDAFRRETDRRLQAERNTMRLQNEQDRVASEMDAARKVQQSLLPEGPPVLRGLQVAVRYLPAGAVGGDIYDFISLNEDEVAFMVADVSGHSLPAALLVAATKGALYDALALAPSDMIAAVNRRLVRDAGSDQFVTMLYACLNAREPGLRWVNAGHPPPILVRAGQPPEALKGSDFVLGVSLNARYAQQACPLRRGDTLLMYSDGLIERHGRDGGVTDGVDFLAALSRARMDGSAEAVAQAVLDVAAALGETRDDVALLVVKLPADDGPDMQHYGVHI